MRLMTRSTRLLLPLLALVLILTTSASRLDASTMGFKFNKAICPQGPAPLGQNWLSLPYSTIYANAADICTALGLAAARGTVTQFNAAVGVILTYRCGDAAPFPINPRVGLVITNPLPTAGVLVGSHAPGPPGTSLFTLGLFPIGHNLFAVPYNSMARNARDVCGQLGLVGTPATITRVDACLGVPLVHFCTDVGPGFSLVVTEAVLVQMPVPAIIGFDPPHF